MNRLLKINFIFFENLTNCFLILYFNFIQYLLSDTKIIKKNIEPCLFLSHLIMADHDLDQCIASLRLTNKKINRALNE